MRTPPPRANGSRGSNSLAEPARHHRSISFNALAEIWKRDYLALSKASLRVPLKVIQERLGHASAGSLTLDIYMHIEWRENVEAAKLAGERIEEAVNSVGLAVNQEEGLPVAEPEALVAA